MAIRIELPSVLFPRLRVCWHTTRTQYERRTRAVREFTHQTATASRVWWRHKTGRIAQRWSLSARRAERRYAEFDAFAQKYEDLVDLLCWAAKDGVQDTMDARYAELRAWMCARYRGLRPHLHPYWVGPDAPDSYDPFEALFASEDLREVINAATGIEDMMQTRAALDAYREVLEAETPRV